jgi:hypothetical protein
MKGPETAAQRLILAAAAAIGVQLAISGVLSLVLPAGQTYIIPSRAGFIDPISYLMTFLAMAVGGWLGGRRFVPVAAVLSVLMWAGILWVLSRTALPGAVRGQAISFSQIAHDNLLGIFLTLLAAAAGAWLGAWLRQRPRLSPTA